MDFILIEDTKKEVALVNGQKWVGIIVCLPPWGDEPVKTGAELGAIKEWCINHSNQILP